MQYIPILFIFIPILAGIIIYLFKHKTVSLIVFPTQVILLVLFILYAYQLQSDPSISLYVIGGWNQRFAITLKNDTLSLLFIALTIFMWTIVLFYTFKTNRKYHKYLFFLMFLEGIFLAFYKQMIYLISSFF